MSAVFDIVLAERLAMFDVKLLQILESGPNFPIS